MEETNINQNNPVRQAPTEKNQTTAKPKSRIPVLLIPVLLLIIGLLGAYIFMNRDSEINNDSANKPSISPTTIPSVVPSSDFETYINSNEGWQIDYPKNEEVKVQTHQSTQIGQNGLGEVVTFTKVGPTQAEGTEFYDGYSVTVGVKKKANDQTVMEFADKDSAPDPNIGTRTPLKAVKINGHDGAETTVSGLGEVKLVYLEYPVLTDRVYYIAIFSTGPGESDAEYDAITEQMLNSFKSVPTSNE
jgi:hypothetical protein